MTILELDRQDLRRTRVIDPPSTPLAQGEARLAVDTFGLTSNNITYAVFDDAMNYWGFFPGEDEDGTHWGRIPVWGFAGVVESTVVGVTEGTRLYGYFPLASELVVEPGRIDDSGFSDMVPHRQSLPSVYNRYSFVDHDPIYRQDREAQQLLLWPLFVTSFVVDDFLGDHGMFDASTVILSSASAKTAIGSAFLLAARPGVEVVGLTSPSNLGFTSGLDCYDQVVTYDQVGALLYADACYVDVAGRRDVTAAVHAHLCDRLRYSMVVGDTHWDHHPDESTPLVGPKPIFLFAPDQITKRRREWGRDGFEEKAAEAWSRFVPWTDTWLTVRAVVGIDRVEAVYRDLLEGRIDPRAGDVCTLHRADGA